MAPLDIARRAVARLAEEGAPPQRLSRWYRTPAWPPGAGPDFVNAALALTFSGAPEELMALLHRVEAGFGRDRRARWAARTLDLDLIAWGGTILPNAAAQSRWRTLPPERQSDAAPAELILPHPRLQDRPFVLVPLAEVAPEWRHPLTGRSVAEMAAALPAAETAAIRPI